MNIEDYQVEELENTINRTVQECSQVLPCKRILTTDEINTIFRAIHSLKSNVLYIDLDEIAEWSIIIEDTLSKIKNGLYCSNEILNWLNNIPEQLNLWLANISTETPLEFLNIFKKKPDWLNTDMEFIYDMSILYVGINSNIQKILKYKFNKFLNLHKPEQIKTYMKSDVDIIILDSKINISTIEFVENLIDPAKNIVIAISHQPTNIFKTVPTNLIFNTKKNRLGNIFNYITNAVVAKPNIIKKYKRKQNLKVKYIEYLVSNITAMPDAINKIKSVISNKYFEIPDLIEAVRKDPIASALVMKAGNDTKYGIKYPPKKIQDTIVLLGPKTVYNILVEKILKKSFKHSLEAYGISIDEFLLLSMKRSIIIDKWVRKNNYTDLEDLSLLVYFAPIGQYILSEDLMFTGKYDIFQNLIEDTNISIFQAEKQIAGYTTTQLSSAILENWGFDQNIYIPLLKVGGFEHGIRDVYMKKSILIVDYVFSKLNQIGQTCVNKTKNETFENKFKEFGLDFESLNKLI